VNGDLFGGEPLPGLKTTENFIDEEEERAFIAAMEDTALRPFRFQGWVGKRETVSFGWRYDFDNGRFEQTDPIPNWLNGLRERAEHVARLQQGELVQALLTRYAPGAGIGWHKDRPVFEHVIGISLGASATMRFRQRHGAKFQRATLPLLPRAAYHLSGEVRHAWEHSITAMTETRWSITFRSLADQ
jgi:DNA oxidative demethylase